MGSAFGAGAGADMLQEILRQKFTQAIQQQKLAEDVRQANMQNAVQQGQLSLGQGNLALGNRREDENTRQYNEAAPMRTANLAHVGAETESLNRQPSEAQQARDFQAAQRIDQQAFQGQQGNLNRSNAVRIANIRQPGDKYQIQPDGKGGLVRIDLDKGTASPIAMGGGATGVQVKGGAGTNATTENRLQSAKSVVQTGNDMIKMLSDPKIAAQLGPVMSRYNSVADFAGNPPPGYAKLAGMIESYSLANMGVHGMRSASGAEAIKNTLGQGRHTPQSMIDAIQGLNGFSNHLMENNHWDPNTVGAGPALGGGSSAPAAALSAADLIKKYGG